MALMFYKIKSNEPVIAHLTLQISRHLALGHKVLWLVPGGSGIAIAVEVAKQLPAADTSNLIVSLTDERYGPLGHSVSNWDQLIKAGFSLADAKLLPVLTGSTIEETTRSYSRLLRDCLKQADFSIALAGIGADGHTFGIKAHSPATISHDTVVAYEADDFYRLTPTLKFIKKLDEVVVYAIGQEKHAQLNNLDRDLAITEQPAQLLKQLKKIVIFNDYKGEEL